MAATADTRPNRQIHPQEITPKDVGIRPSDELWNLWRATGSEAQVLRRLGEMLKELEHTDSTETMSLAGMWRHIRCSAELLREDIDDCEWRDAMVVSF